MKARRALGSGALHARSLPAEVGMDGLNRSAQSFHFPLQSFVPFQWG